MSKIVNQAPAAIAAATLPAAAAHAAWELNMPVGVTELSREIHGLHMLILWVCVLIAVAVFGMLIYSIVKFRHSKGAVAANFDHSTKAEVIWTLIPIAILVGLATPAAETLIKIEDTRDSDLTVKVTGYQWKWHYDYLDQDVSFFSTLERRSDAARQLGSGIDPRSVENYLLEVDNRMVVPVGAKVRVLLTAADVIHSWWVPEFGMKKDAIPGFINELWFRADEVGVYRGQCAELCGRDHAFMPVVVEVKSQAEYAAWLESRRAETQTTALAAAQ
ncbi:MAG: cytochrome c oxidase subunit II [Steroidobacteraceae bacterium]|jgi:cytochrome c oxidase subunit 2|nr:cytochrome c oxidase subunit II [Steroidobacteraceae bacterium]